MKTTVIIFALALSACQAMPPPVELPPAPAAPVEVVLAKTPVPIDCTVEIGPDPNYPDTRAALLAAPYPDAERQFAADPTNLDAMEKILENLRYRVQLMSAAWPMKNVRLQQYREALKACASQVMNR